MMNKLLSLLKNRWSSIKLYVLIGVITIIFAIAAGITDGTENNNLIFTKGQPGDIKQVQNYTLNIPGLVEDFPYEIVIDNRHLTVDEQKKLFSDAIIELEKCILGDNDSLDHIVSGLNLVDSLQNGLIKVTYSWNNHRILNYEGQPVSENLVEEGSLVEIIAKLTCENETIDYKFFVRVFPPQKSVTQKAIEAIDQALSLQNESESDCVRLPEKFGNLPISWEVDRGTNKSLVILLIGFVAIAGVAVGRKNDARKAKKKRDGTLVEEYSGLLNQLSLLLSAGMTVLAAWERIVKNYQYKMIGKKDKEKKPAYEEMAITYNQIKDGMSERQAYEQFADRVGVAEYRKLSNLLTQNLRKGTSGLGRVLEEESVDAYSKQQSIVKKKGEEMSTKLLLPMMLMLGLVIVMIVIPAIFNFGV